MAKNMKQKWERFFKIAKIDEDQQMVYGYASTPDLDSDGEIIKVEAIEKSLPDYLKFPTIREMHQPKAVGTTKEATVTKKGLYIGAKIVDKGAWELVKEGVYKAFSIGGDVVKRVGNVIQELDLIEISLVDVPANKSAVIEVWKRGKLSKNAETAYAMANLMIQVKDLIFWWDYNGKDTTQLKALLEEIKTLLVVEAQELEAQEAQEMEADDIYAGKTSMELQKKISTLEAIDFSKNPVADLIRRGVIISMTKKANELKKAEGETEEKAEDQETETKESEDTSDETTETEDETTETTDGEAEGSDEKEAGVEATLLKVEKTLEKLTATKKEKASPEITKAISSMAGNLAKMADVISTMDDRLTKLEKQPAPAKSRSAVVLKGQDKEEAEDEKKESGLLKSKKERLNELNGIFDQVGSAEFAKRGHSVEAAKLMNEISALQA